MNVKRTAACILLIVFAAFCAGLDNIDVVARGQTIVPQRTLIDEVVGQFGFLGFEGFDISESQEFRNQGYTKDQIDSVRLSRFALTITTPSDGEFDFIESIRFFAESEGLPRVEVARLDPVPDGLRELELELLDVELADYAAADSMTITTEATGLRPSEETTIDAEVVFNVDINVDGAVGCVVASVASASP